tara:strand:+ start:327 stop:539 length:213 start_codon:yes stop_codon:yes gene_type:complete
MENRKTRKIKKYLDKQLSILEKNNKNKITNYKVKRGERYDWNGKIIHKSNKGVKSDNVKSISNETPDVKR